MTGDRRSVTRRAASVSWRVLDFYLRSSRFSKRKKKKKSTIGLTPDTRRVDQTICLHARSEDETLCRKNRPFHTRSPVVPIPVVHSHGGHATKASAEAAGHRTLER